MTTASRWGVRAAELYGDAYARRYRVHDDAIRDGELVTRFSGWLGGICDRFGRDIDIRDLGCGTGRYFHALRHVRRLVGIDVAQPMLDEARHPVGSPALRAELVAEGADLFEARYQWAQIRHRLAEVCRAVAVGASGDGISNHGR